MPDASNTILENYVVAEIRKTCLNSGKGPFMYYYRDKDAKEIDIILKFDGALSPVEIKKSANPGSGLTGVFHRLDNGSVPREKGHPLYEAGAFCSRQGKFYRSNLDDLSLKLSGL